jgi:hypothetical protein
MIVDGGAHIGDAEDRDDKLEPVRLSFLRVGAGRDLISGWQG